MENTKQNKKYNIIIISMCLAFCAILGTIVGVWAATTQTVKASFNVQYSVGDNVAAKIRTEYTTNSTTTIVHNDDKGTKVTDENGFVVYNATDDEGSKSVYIGDFELSPQNPEVVFYFTVENILQSGYIVPVFKTEFTIQNNVELTTYYNADTDSSVSASTIETWSEIAPTENLAAGKCMAVKMVLWIPNVNTSASCVGSAAINLTYSSASQGAGN